MEGKLVLNAPYQPLLVRFRASPYPAPKRGRHQVLPRPCSTSHRLGSVTMKHGYSGFFEIIDHHSTGKIVVNLTSRLNKCGVISPRFDVQPRIDLEKRQNNMPLSYQFGFIVLTTSLGNTGHEEATRRQTGEKILGLFFMRCNTYVQIKYLSGLWCFPRFFALYSRVARVPAAMCSLC